LGPKGSLGAVGHADALEDVGQMGLHGLEADAELMGDYLVGQALGDQAQDLTLPGREAVPGLALIAQHEKGLGCTGRERRIAGRCGCRVVALTSREVLGAREHGWSAVLYDAATGSLLRSRRHVVRVVDRVGGGDGFAAGLIAALVSRRAPAEALEFAVAAGALKLTIPGDFCRVSAAEVERVLQS